MENKERANTRKETIAKSFQMALGCPVQVNLSLAACAQEGSQGREILMEKPVENAHPDQTNKKSLRTKKVKSQRNEDHAILAELSANEKDPSLVDKICRSISSNNPKAGLTSKHILMRNSSLSGSLTRHSTIDEKPRSNSTHFSSQARDVAKSQRALDRREDATIVASSTNKERLSTQQEDMDPINAAKSIAYAKNGLSLKVDTRVSTTNCQSFSVHDEPSSDHLETRYVTKISLDKILILFFLFFFSLPFFKKLKTCFFNHITRKECHELRSL